MQVSAHFAKGASIYDVHKISTPKPQPSGFNCREARDTWRPSFSHERQGVCLRRYAGFYVLLHTSTSQVAGIHLSGISYDKTALNRTSSALCSFRFLQQDSPPVLYVDPGYR